MSPALLQSVGQSLAGRTALLELLPLALEEVRRFDDPPGDLLELMWKGSAPAVYDRRLEPADWYASYVATYVERDVRSVLNVGDLPTFQSFLRLSAGRTVAADFFSGLDALATLAAKEKPPRGVRKVVVYGGDETQHRSDATALSWSDLDKESWFNPEH